MQIPLLLGRDLDERDQSGDAKVVVVNEVFARKFFAGANPIGKHVGIGSHKDPDLEIVGVAKASRHQSLQQDIPPVVYLPFALDPTELYGMTYEVRTAGDPLALVDTARRLIREADSRVPVADVSTQASSIDGTIVQERTFATLCTWFALLEIGLRMALGARQGRLLWMVMREVVTLATVGLAVGLPVAYLLSHVVESYLFGMKAHDPLVLVGAPLALVVAVLVAGYGPAWRASRIDPWLALRNE